MIRPFVTVIAPLLCACLDVQPAAMYCATEPAPAASRQPGMTYHRDIEPLINAKCAGCHSNSGAGPFSLTNWAEVKPHVDEIFAAVVGHGPIALSDALEAAARSDLYAAVRDMSGEILNLGRVNGSRRRYRTWR